MAREKEQEKWKCEKCGKEFATRKDAEKHEKDCGKYEQKNPLWWLGVLLFLIVISSLWFLSDFNKFDGYKDCVNDCTYHQESCLYDLNAIYSQNSMIDYIELYDAVDCATDLEDCIRGCEK